MDVAYANCFGAEAGDLLLTDETAIAATVANARVTDALIDPDDGQAANIAIWRLAFDWFRDGDPTLVDGISAADVAGAEVAISVLIPAARAALGVAAALAGIDARSFTSWAPAVGGERYRAIEAVACAAADAVAGARPGVRIERRSASDARTGALVAKYRSTRDPVWLSPEPRRRRDEAAARVLNAAAWLRSPRTRPTLLVYEYNPTHAFASRYAGGALRLARCRTPRAALAEIPRAGDRLLLPPAVAAGEHAGVRARLAGFKPRPFEVAGVDLTAVVAPRLAAIAARYARFVEAAAPRWRALLRRTGVEAVLVPFDGPPETRLLVRVAQSQGIPTFVLNDGFKADDFSPECMTADHGLAWSPAIAEAYFSRRSQNRTVVTGNPKADAQRRVGPARAPAGARIARLLVGSFTFSPVDLNCRRSDAEWFLEGVLDGVRASQAARAAHLTLKLHPADRADHYAEVLARFPELSTEIVSSGDVVAMFDACDVYLTTYSTSLLEAIALGVPSIYYRVNDQRLHAPFAGDDPVLAPRTAASAPDLARLLDDPRVQRLPPVAERAAWIERYLGPADGRSVERIEAAIRRAL